MQTKYILRLAKYINHNSLFVFKEVGMKKIRALLLVLLSYPLVLAAPDGVEAVSDAIFLPLLEVVRPLFVKLSFVIGGIFGATLLLVVVRVYYEHKTLKLLSAIRFDLDQHNKHLGIRYSTQKRSIFKRWLEYWKEHSHNRAVKKLERFRDKKQ